MSTPSSRIRRIAGALVAAACFLPSASGADLGRDFKILQAESEILQTLPSSLAPQVQEEILKSFQARILELYKTNPSWSQSSTVIYKDIYLPVWKLCSHETVRGNPDIKSRDAALRVLLGQRDAKEVLDEWIAKSKDKARPDIEAMAAELRNMGYSGERTLATAETSIWHDQLDRWVKAWDPFKLSGADLKENIAALGKACQPLEPAFVQRLDSKTAGLLNTLEIMEKKLLEACLDSRNASGARSAQFEKLNPCIRALTDFYKSVFKGSDQPIRSLRQQAGDLFCSVNIENAVQGAHALVEVRCMQRDGRGTFGIVRVEDAADGLLYVLPFAVNIRPVVNCFVFNEASSGLPAALVVLISEEKKKFVKIPELPEKFQPGRVLSYDELLQINQYLWLDRDCWSLCKAVERLQKVSRTSSKFGGKSFSEVLPDFWAASGLSAARPWSDAVLEESAAICRDPSKVPPEWLKPLAFKQSPPRDQVELITALLEKGELLPDSGVLKRILVQLKPVAGLEASLANLDKGGLPVGAEGASGIGIRTILQEESVRKK